MFKKVGSQIYYVQVKLRKRTVAKWTPCTCLGIYYDGTGALFNLK